MKRIFFILLFFILVSFAFGQTWKVDGGADWDYEYTVINKDSYERILKANGVTLV